jgi:hypothetical protein
MDQKCAWEGRELARAILATCAKWKARYRRAAAVGGESLQQAAANRQSVQRPGGAEQTPQPRKEGPRSLLRLGRWRERCA